MLQASAAAPQQPTGRQREQGRLCQKRAVLCGVCCAHDDEVHLAGDVPLLEHRLLREHDVRRHRQRQLLQERRLEAAQQRHRGEGRPVHVEHDRLVELLGEFFELAHPLLPRVGGALHELVVVADWCPCPGEKGSADGSRRQRCMAPGRAGRRGGERERKQRESGRRRRRRGRTSVLEAHGQLEVPGGGEDELALLAVARGGDVGTLDDDGLRWVGGVGMVGPASAGGGEAGTAAQGEREGPGGRRAMLPTTTACTNPPSMMTMAAKKRSSLVKQYALRATGGGFSSCWLPG